MRSQHQESRKHWKSLPFQLSPETGGDSWNLCDQVQIREGSKEVTKDHLLPFLTMALVTTKVTSIHSTFA